MTFRGFSRQTLHADVLNVGSDVTRSVSGCLCRCQRGDCMISLCECVCVGFSVCVCVSVCFAQQDPLGGNMHRPFFTDLADWSSLSI